MNPVPLFLIIVTLPLLLGGCGEKHEGVNLEELEISGDIFNEIAYHKGSPYTGKSINYYENGKKESEYNFKDGKKDGLEVVYFFRSQLSRFLKPWSNGQKKEEINYKGGKKNGLETQWYENGQKKIETNYKDGRKVGLQAVWYSNGEKWP